MASSIGGARDGAPGGADHVTLATTTQRCRMASAGCRWRLRKELGPHARDDAATRALYSSDASNYRVLPAIVVAPGSADELAAVVVGLAVEAGVPVTMRGAGTSIAGNAIGSGVVIETRRLDRILDIDPEARTATVEPGVVLGDLTPGPRSSGSASGPTHRPTAAAPWAA